MTKVLTTQKINLAWIALAWITCGWIVPAQAQTQDCSTKTSSAEMQQCELLVRETAISTIRAAYQDALIGLSDVDQTLLLEAQNAWDNFRDKECARLGSASGDGTMVRLVELSCFNEMTFARVAVFSTNPLTGEVNLPVTNVEQEKHDVLDPAKGIIDLLDERLTGESAASYFDDAKLRSIYSNRFVEIYHKATAKAQSKGMAAPLDYDVILQAQDGCPPENLKFKVFPESLGATIVMATFQTKACWGSTEEQQVYSEVRFQMIIQNGSYVIDDIIILLEDGSYTTVVAELEAM